MNKIRNITMMVGQTILEVNMATRVVIGKKQKERIKNSALCAEKEINNLLDNDKYELKNNVIFVLAHIDRCIKSILEEVE
jgi:hypothetical protein